jgi:hypothetical protein
MTHKFKLGQSVQFTPKFAHGSGARGLYKIVQLLPIESDECRYRIKGSHENFERVAEEHQLRHDS